MRHPRRRRNLAVVVLAASLVALAATFLIPDTPENLTLNTILGVGGVTLGFWSAVAAAWMQAQAVG